MILSSYIDFYRWEKEGTEVKMQRRESRVANYTDDELFSLSKSYIW